ncbi:uncharacterized protein LOC135484228 [Lineus longissimus]|uniref:uncharacterized protein LOC135484228 n=1 Tax=Lineus longissimus TaxID=88925 RepID=UPI00315D6FFC
MVDSKRVDGLVVRGLQESMEIMLPTSFTREIPADDSLIPKVNTVKEWPHLVKVASQLTPYMGNIDIGLLIGSNCMRAIKPIEIAPGELDDPYGVRTALGWGVVGAMGKSQCSSNCKTNCSSCQLVQVSHFAFQTRVKEVSPREVAKMLEFEFNEPASCAFERLSFEDNLFMKIVTEGIHKRSDGHYEMPLPLKGADVSVPNNRSMAEKRAISLRRKMIKDPGYKKDYTVFMDTLIAKGHAEPVPKEEIDVKNGKVWCIPHHGVYHPHKPSKIRVVFDCSAEFAGEVLNRHLLQGPDMTNNLAGVLCRFRKGQIPITCDIEGMFHQVGVNVEHRNLLRFLWWEGGNLNNAPKEYRMTVHLFGATSSPGCANFALKRAASDHEAVYRKESADFVRNDFYVDDGCSSKDGNPKDTVNMIEGAIGICNQGGFRLHKVMSSDKQVLAAIPPSERGKGIQTLDLCRDSLPVEHTLGIL